MKKWFTDLLGAPILVRKTPFKVARLLELVTDPETGNLVALITASHQVISPIDLCPYQFGRIQVREADVLLEMDELIRLKNLPKEKRRLFGKKVVTKSGQKLGRVYDLAYDMTTFSLVQFLVSRKVFFLWTLEKRIFSFRDIVEIRDKEIVVKDSCAGTKVPTQEAAPTISAA